MKKLAVFALTLAAVLTVGYAAMDNVKIIDASTVALTALTNNVIVRGTLHAINVDVTTPCTNAIDVADEFGQVLYTNGTCSADALIYPFRTGTDNTGAALVSSVGGTNYTFTTYKLATKVTARVRPAAGQATTNACTITLIVDK